MDAATNEATPSKLRLYIVAADGNSQPTQVGLRNLSGEQLQPMKFVRWQ